VSWCRPYFSKPHPESCYSAATCKVLPTSCCEGRGSVIRILDGTTLCIKFAVKVRNVSSYLLQTQSLDSCLPSRCVFEARVDDNGRFKSQAVRVQLSGEFATSQFKLREYT
jgi:hypothetical protein